MDKFLRIATAVAYEAGRVISDSFGAGHLYTLKDDYTPVTEADLAVNNLVITRLSAAFPEHRLLGEEGTLERESRYTWVFDPIDGTVPYVRGIPTNVFSLALVEDGVPVLGVVYDPHMQRLYHAVKGDGAYRNQKRIETSGAMELTRSYVETGHHRGFKDLALFERFRNADVRFLSYNSTVYAAMLVAAGQIEGVVYPGNKPWDAAAAKVIIEEAGGVATDMYGNDQRYDAPVTGFIAGATREYHEKLFALSAPSLP